MSKGLGLLDTSEVKDWLTDLGLVHWPSFYVEYKTSRTWFGWTSCWSHQLAVFRQPMPKLERAVMALRKERGIPEPQYKVPQPRAVACRHARGAHVRERPEATSTQVLHRALARAEWSQPSGSRSSSPWCPCNHGLLCRRQYSQDRARRSSAGMRCHPPDARPLRANAQRKPRPQCDDGPDGRVYEGEWRDGRRCGKGEETLRSGERYVGDWDSDEKSDR